MPSNSPLFSSIQSLDDKDTDEVLGKGDDDVNKVSGINDRGRTNSSTQDVNTTGPKETGIFDGTYDDEDVGADADLNNLETTMNVSPIPITRIYKDHPKDQIIRDLSLATQTRRMINFSKEHDRKKQANYSTGITSRGGQTMHDVFALVARIEAIRGGYVCQSPCFEDPQFPDKVYKVEKALYGLHQAPRAWYETLSTYLLENRFRRGIIDKTLFIKKDREFESLMHKKFQMSSIRELTFFLGLQVMQRDDGIFISQDKYVADKLKKFDFSSVKTASTLMEPTKHWFQVTPKVSHLHAVKRIFRYLKVQPKLGLWYPRDSPFDLEAFSDSDYAGASLDRKSTT
ncbi:putative ribonuclease H-like domain-containing protein [Tanacetum coccineum]|uniref:Ribonuclease H-like domain-containing protein n=1 Tax=Tanacetum coccineum TaxID=301880 RepID=A0ABQ5AFA1_9ASTR